MELPVPSRVSYSSFFAWLQALLRPLRVPIVFLLSGLVSFCAFKDGNAVIGAGPGAVVRTPRGWLCGTRI